MTYTVPDYVRRHLIKAYHQSALRGVPDRLYYRVRKRNGETWLFRIYADDHGCPTISLTARTETERLVDGLTVWPRDRREK